MSVVDHVVDAVAEGLAGRGLVVAAPGAGLSNPTACLPPGFSGPISTALGWVKAIALVVAIVSMVRIGVHVLRQQGDGVPDRDDTFDKIFNWVVGVFIIAGTVSLLSALGLSVATSC
ncbi:MAG: hypothetical protein LKI21_07560 [Bifidobacterium crudilactis]|nr:hypothetical protein [Bifidobacterium crudilactis]